MPRPLRLLIVEDSPADAELLEAELKLHAFEPSVRRVETKQAMENALADTWDVVVTDYILPAFSGLEAIQLARAKDDDLPILLMSGKVKEDVIVQAIKSGANDYLLKDNLQRLVPTIERELKSASERRQKRRAESALLKSQEELAEINRNLEEEIRKRTADLRAKERELEQSRKLEAVGRLAGGVAHDFNNLITGILGVAEEVKSSFQDGDERIGEMSVIMDAADRAIAVTRQLLTFARREIAQPRVVNVNEVIDGMQKLLKRFIGEDLQVHTTLAQTAAVRIDPVHLEQVILNLAVNARDAMPNGGAIFIGTRQADHALSSNGHGSVPMKCVVIEFSDNGHGMTPDVMTHIFEPFFTTKGKEKGTGLGLSTVYGIVKQNNGHIHVESTPGKGAKFQIFLPVVDAPALEEPLHAPDVPASTKGKETILVVEDEEIVRRVVIRKLRRQGYNILEATNGKEALALAEQHAQHIDLVLTDVVMPGMNGREMVNQLRSFHPGIGVLFMSGYTADIIANRGVLEPGIDFIDKGSLNKEIDGKVRDILDRRPTFNAPGSRETAG